MLAEFTEWLLDVVGQFFEDLWELVQDAFLWVVQQITDAVLWVLEQIPVPDFVANGMQALFDGLPQGTLYILGQLSIGTGLAMIGAGYGFRMVRKLLTLFQW